MKSIVLVVEERIVFFGKTGFEFRPEVIQHGGIDPVKSFSEDNRFQFDPGVK